MKDRNKKINIENYKKSDEDVIKKKLSKKQYDVTQKNHTEPPFQNEHWDN